MLLLPTVLQIQMIQWDKLAILCIAGMARMLAAEIEAGAGLAPDWPKVDAALRKQLTPAAVTELREEIKDLIDDLGS
jgi:hypothetical protein